MKQLHTILGLKNEAEVIKWASSVCYKHTSRSIHKEDFEDILSECLLCLWECYLKSPVSKEGSFKCYAYIRMRGVVLDWFRSQKNRDHINIEDTVIVSQEISLEELYDLKIETGYVLKAYKTLDKDERNLIKERFVYEKTFSEMANSLQLVNRSATLKRVQKALQKLKTQVASFCGHRSLQFKHGDICAEATALAA